MLGFAFMMTVAAMGVAAWVVSADDAAIARFEATERYEAARAEAAVLWERFRAAEKARSSDYWRARDEWLRAHSKARNARVLADRL